MFAIMKVPNVVSNRPRQAICLPGSLRRPNSKVEPKEEEEDVSAFTGGDFDTGDVGLSGVADDSELKFEPPPPPPKKEA